MSQMTRFASTGGLLLALCGAFAGCSSRTNVSATGNTPTQFTHVFITAQAVWFNTNKAATPDDAGWARFQLKTPVTIDLVQQSNGTLGELANDLRVAPGTYNSILLLPVDPATPLTASAQAVGAINFNQEAQYADAGGTHPVQLTIPNPEKGIVVTGTLKVPIGKATTGTGGVGLPIGGSTSTTNTNTTNQAQNVFGSPTTINSTTNSTTTNSTTNNTTTVSFGVTFDGDRDLHMFNFPVGTTTTTQVLLSSNATATDLSTTGGITGTLTLTNITNVTSNPSIANAYSSRTAIEASAEVLSADSTHYTIVASAPVQSDGTFTVYPLEADVKNGTTYDLVIHGPQIATIIIKNVSVTRTTPTLTAAASTTGAVATTTASGAVSVGTLIPRTAFSYPVNIAATAGATLPAGAALAFYQTLGNDAPHAIDEVGIDPVNHTLMTSELLSSNTIDSGTYGSNGGTITLTQSTPNEKQGNYDVGATAPLYTDSAPSGTYLVKAPSSTMGTGAANSTTALSITTMPTLQPANAAATGTLTVSLTDTAGDTAGTLLVSHNGAVIATADLASALKTGGIGSVPPINGLPSGNLYYLSAILMNASTGFRYVSIPTPVNLSGGSATATVSIAN